MRLQWDNPNFQAAVMLGVLLAGMVASEYLPYSRTVRGLVVFGLYIAIFGVMVTQQLYLQWKYSAFKHIKANIRLPAGNTIERDIFLPPETESARLKEMELEDGWKGFVLNLKNEIKMGPYNTKQIILISPMKFDDTFMFRPRYKAAYVNGVPISHPASDIATLYMYPLPHKDHDKEIPILFVVEAGGMFPKLAKFPREPLNEKLPYMAMVKDLHRKVIALEYTNKTLHEQLAGFIEETKDLKKSVAEHLSLLRAWHGDIEKVSVRPRLLKFDLTTIVAMGVIALIIGYLYLNPTVTTQLLSAFASSIPYMIVAGLIGLAVLYRWRRKK